MGAKISKQHNPKRLQALKDAEQAVLEHYKARTVQLEEVWIDLPQDDAKLKDAYTGVSKVRSFQINLNGTSTKPEDDHVVLLIHGGGGTVSDWAALYAPLFQYAAATKEETTRLRFWFIERPGHGLSDPYDYLSNVPGRMDEHITAVLEGVRRVAGVDKVHLVGNSFGGAVVYFYARHYPQHVRSFTWIGAEAMHSTADFPLPLRFMGSWMGTEVSAMGTPKIASRHLIRMFEQEPDKVPECMIDLYYKHMRLRNNAISFSLLLRCMFLDLRKYQYDLKVDPAEMAKQFPCQQVIGSHDPFLTKEEQQLIADGFGRTNLVVGSGHMPWLDDPQDVAQAITQFVLSA